MSIYDSKDEKNAKASRDLKKAKEVQDFIAGQIAQCFSTEAGKYTLSYLMKYCGFELGPTAFNQVTGEPIVGLTLFNDGKAEVYRHLRSILKQKAPALLQETEF